MIISPGRGYIFVHIPKTGGTSLTAALEDRAMADDILIGDTPKARRRRERLKQLTPRGRLWKHSTLADIDGLPGTDALERMLIVTLVRNPWDRLVSYYEWARVQDFDHPAINTAKALSFNDFLRDDGIANSLRNSPVRHYLTDASGRLHSGVCARLEAFATDLDPLWEHLGFRLEIPHLNRSDRISDYRRYYTDDLADFVGNLMADDIKRFGYRF